MEFGLIGKKLGHSFSPIIHEELGGYNYTLTELQEEEVGPFLRSGTFRGLNVTIPYKRTVMPYLDRISDRARRIGSVNTIVREADGSLSGYNTDYAGFQALLRKGNLHPEGTKCLVLGSGGAGRTAVSVLEDMGAREVRVISRSGEDHYGNLEKHADAGILVNATPVGMYPGNGESPVDPGRLPMLEGIADLIYNPARTALLLAGEKRGIPGINGLYMLVAQARMAAELFLRRPVPEEACEKIWRRLKAQTENWVLIGMAGSGKSTVGRLLAERTGRELLDTDEMAEQACGMSCGEYIRRQGEDAFRILETDRIREAGKRTGVIIATGGGAVIRPENRDLLRQNGTLFHLDREAEALAVSESRPLSDTREKALQLARERAPLYAAWRDARIAESTPEKAAERILALAEQWKQEETDA